MYKSNIFLIITLNCCIFSCARANDNYIKEFYKDVKYSKACGPIACYVALKYLGKDISLDSIQQKCKWSEGKSTSLGTLEKVLSEIDGINTKGVKINLDNLFDLLKSKKCVAILPIRKFTDEIDHVFTAVGVQNNSIMLIDYPELAMKKRKEELLDIWDGNAILVYKNTTISKIYFITLLIILFVIIIVTNLYISQKKRIVKS